MLGAIKAALTAALTAIKSSLPAIVASITATVLLGGCIYYYTIKDGIYERSASNVRYVLEQYMSQIGVGSIVDNGRGGYAYTTNLDEMADDILLKLKEAKSNISSYTGKGKEKEFIKKLIKAELITQYPDLRTEEEIKNSSEIPENEVQGGIKIVRSNSSVAVTGVDTENIEEYTLQDKNVLTYMPYNEFKQLIRDGNETVKNYYSLKSSGISSSTSGNFVVKIDEANAAPVLTREQVNNAIIHTYSGTAETNLIGALDAFMKIQEEYKVNAIFAIAVTQAESSCGTNWNLINPDSYNWMSVKSTEHESGWAQYNSFSHATEEFGKRISGANGSPYYFQANKYSVNEIGPVYCPDPPGYWPNHVNEFMARLYNSIGIQISTSGQVTNITQTNTSNSVDLIVAGWNEEQTVEITKEYVKNNVGEEVLNENTQDSGVHSNFYEVSINYQNMLSKYSMPAGFLWSLLVMGEDTQFTLKLADLAINETNIVIEAQDNNTETINGSIKKYNNKKIANKTIKAEDSTVTSKEYEYIASESSIIKTVTTRNSNTRLNLVYAETWVATYKANYKNNVNSTDGLDIYWYQHIADDEWQLLEDEEVGTNPTHFRSNDPNNDDDYRDIKNYYINTIIDMQRCEDKVDGIMSDLRSINSPLAYFYYNLPSDPNVGTLKANMRNYIYNYVHNRSRRQEKENIGNAINALWERQGEILIDLGMYENKDTIIDNLYTKLDLTATSMKTLVSAEMDISEWRINNKFASNMQTVNTNTFVSAGTVVKERTDIDEENNFVEYFNNSRRAKEYILGAPSWLYEMLESQEKTANMLDLFKYLLYKATDTNYGVTTFDFKLNSTITGGMVGAINGSGFWWPIGSEIAEDRNGILFASGEPVSSHISSPYGMRFMNGEWSLHKGIDIANRSGNNSPGSYVIAVAPGVVTAVVDGYGNNFSTEGVPDSISAGNYVKIDHGNGYETRYLHLYRNTITVSVGDVVEYGQVLGQIGSSGRSTGGHLHFGVRLNGTDVNPVDYVDMNNPRPQWRGVISQQLYSFIRAFEGGTQYYNEADRTYTVFNNGVRGDDNLELTGGIAIGTRRRGIFDGYRDIFDASTTVGSIITEEQYNEVLTRVLEGKMSTVDNAIAATGAILTQQQKDAVYSLCYNVANSFKRTKEALIAFNTNGDIGYWRYIHNITNSGLDGLVRRRAEEFEMFRDGEYVPAQYSEAIVKFRSYNRESGLPENDGA